MAQYRGTGVVTLRRLIEAQGADFKNKIYAALTPAEQKIIQNALPVDWLDLSQVGSLISGIYAAVAKKMFPGQDHPIRLLGKAKAEHEFTRNGIFSVFLKIISVEMVAKQVAKLHKRYYDQGEASLVMTGPTSFDYICRDFPDFPPAFQEANQGYMLALIDACGGRDIRLDIVKDEPNERIWRYSWT